ncbi:MAG: DNA polymerase III subunit delta [Microbacteriaceae bacterium]|nr:DNA polymerase III subunit delta [Microbacteriaceae bacterium]
MATKRGTGGKSGGKSAAKRRIQDVHWRRPHPAPVVLVSGGEDFMAREAITALRTILRTEDPSLEVSELDAREYAPGELTTLASPSLFMEPRYIVAEQVQDCTDAFIEDALDVIAAPIDGTTIVLRHSGGVRGKRLLDAVRGLEHAIEIACTPLKQHEQTGFVNDEFRARDRRVLPEAAQALVNAFHTDLAELAAACRQLMSVSDEREIVPELVERYYGGRVETSGFKIADEAIAGRIGNAIALVRAGFDTGVNPVPIVAAFAMKLRTMAKVSDLAGSDGQIAGQVGAAPWQVQAARRELRGWTEHELSAAIRLTAETDWLVKGGSRDAEFAVERLVRRVAAREL